MSYMSYKSAIFLDGVGFGWGSASRLPLGRSGQGEQSGGTDASDRRGWFVREYRDNRREYRLFRAGENPETQNKL
jgi:hypothetical protein